MSYTDSIEADHKNLAELLPENLDCPEQPQPTFALAGAYLISSPSAHPRSKEMHEVVTCVECFVSYMSVVTAENPLHPHDLLTYVVNLTHCKHFGGLTWLHYDRAFRQEAAASGLKDWSKMRTDLYNFHTAGGNAAFNHATTTPFRGRDSEAVIAARRGEICRSWSNGKCSSQYTTCSYQHR